LNFRIKILLRVILILALGSGGIYIFINAYFWLIGVWLIVFALIALWELMRFLEKGNRELANFLLSLQQNDFTGNYEFTQNKEVDRTFKVITSEFKKLRQSSASNLQFLNVVIEQSTVPMIGYRLDNGDIKVFNQAAKKIIGKPYMNSFSALKSVSHEIYEAFHNIKSGEKELIKVVLNNQINHLSILAKELKLENDHIKLITFQNIKQELDQQELESWQKLIRVLTHEIKNSAIPISTLTEVISQMLKDEEGNIRDFSALDSEDLEDLLVAINTIEKRSKGLVKFVNAYGELAKIPEPTITQVDLTELIDNVLSLLKNSLNKNDVQIELALDAKHLMADVNLLEQVFINLIKNANEALSDIKNPSISISAYEDERKLVIEITDNGIGMDENTIESVFVPFYTTKKTGSGIGLSLSKEIIRAHQGTLSVSSEKDKYTTFRIEL